MIVHQGKWPQFFNDVLSRPVQVIEILPTISDFSLVNQYCVKWERSIYNYADT